MSMPTSTCFRTTSAIPVRMSAASLASSYGRPTIRAFIPSMISRVRARLPVWVVRMRAVLRFTHYSHRGGSLAGDLVEVAHRARAGDDRAERVGQVSQEQTALRPVGWRIEADGRVGDQAG